MTIRTAITVVVVLILGRPLPAQQSGTNYEKFCRVYPKESKTYQEKHRDLYLKHCQKTGSFVEVAPKHATKPLGKRMRPREGRAMGQWQGHLSQAELREVAGRLGSRRTASYTHYLYQVRKLKNGRHTFSLVSKDRLRGLLFARDSRYLEPLGGGFYDDGHGNLILSNFSDADETAHYSVTFTPRGRVLGGVDRNGDGVVEMALGSMGHDRFWMLVDAAGLDFQWMLKCMAAARANEMVSAALNCSVGGRQSADRGLSGGFRVFDDFVSDLTNPDCGSGEAFQFGVADVEQTAQYYDSVGDAFHASAERERAREGGVIHPVDQDFAAALERIAVAAHRLAQRIREFGAVLDSDTELARHGWGLLPAQRNLADAQREFNWAVADAERMERDTASLRTSPPPRIYHWEKRFIRMLWRGATGGVFQPPVGPEGSFRDPRCRTRPDAGFGTLFMNKEFCGDDDPITCLRRQMDRVYDLTGKSCWTEIGRNDAKVMVCVSNEERPSGGGDAAGPSPGGPNSGRTDIPQPDRGRSGPVDYGYVDTTPLGAFVLSWCQHAGGTGPCGDMPPTLSPR